MAAFDHYKSAFCHTSSVFDLVRRNDARLTIASGTSRRDGYSRKERGTAFEADPYLWPTVQERLYHLQVREASF
jgi:hypothetical protein